MADDAYSIPVSGAHRAPQGPFKAFALPTQPDGRRTALVAALERLEDLRQEMIEELDELDGEPDLEPEPDEDDCDSESDIDHVGYRWCEGPDAQWWRHTRFNMGEA